MKALATALIAALFLFHSLAFAQQLNPTPDPCCFNLTMSNAEEASPGDLKGPACPYPKLDFADDGTASVKVNITHKSTSNATQGITGTVSARSSDGTVHPTTHNVSNLAKGNTSAALEFVFTEADLRENKEWEILFSCDPGTSTTTSIGECPVRIPVNKDGCKECSTCDGESQEPSLNDDGSANMPLAPQNGGSSSGGGGHMLYRPTGTDTDADLANPGPIALTPSISKNYTGTRGGNGAISSISSRNGNVQVLPAAASLLAQDPNAFTIVHKNASDQEYRTTTCALINDGGVKRLRMDTFFNGATTRYEQTKTSPNIRILERGRIVDGIFAPLRQITYVRNEPSPGTRVYRITVKERPSTSDAWSVVSVTETTWQRQIYYWVMTKQIIDPDGEALTSTWTYYQPGESTGINPEIQFSGSNIPLVGGTSSTRGIGRLKQVTRYDGYQAFYTYSHNTQTVTLPYAGNPSGKVITTTWEPGSRTRTMTTRINGIISAQESEKFTDTTMITTTVCAVGGGSGGIGITKVRPSNFKVCGNNQDFGGKVDLTEHEDGTITTYEYTRHTGGGYTTVTETGSTTNGTTVAKGTRTTTTKNSRGTTILSKTEGIGYGTGSAIFDSMAVTEVDSVGRALTTAYHPETATLTGEIATASNPAWTTTTEYSCCGIARQTDKYGVKTLYAHDGLQRRIKSNTLGVTTEMRYNGLTVETHRYAEIANTSLPAIPLANNNTIISKSVRNLSGTYQESWSPDPTSATAGDLVKSSTSTTFQPATGLSRRTVTTTADNHTQTTDSFLDGRTFKTYGALSPAMQYGYAVNTIGEVTSQSYLDGTTLRETTSTQTDWDGRTLRMDYMDGAFATMEYNDKNQMVKSTDPDGVVTLMAYNAEGEQTITATDLNRNGAVDYGSDTVQFSESVPALDSNNKPVWKSTSKIWQPGDTSPSGGTIVSTSFQSANGLKSESQSIGVANPSSSVTTLNGNGNWTTVSIAPDGTKSASQYTGGRMVAMESLTTTNAIIESQTQTYDSLNRPRISTHSRTGASTTNYLSNTSDNVVSVSDADGRTTAFVYDIRGRQVSLNAPDTLDAQGATLTNVTTTTYKPDNTVAETNGDQTYRVSHTYDYADRQVSMTTYGTTTATTTWQYSTTRGFLLSKRDAANKGANYTHTAAGRIATRTWARGVVTTYSHDNGGRMISTNYSDTTPDIAITYDALNRPLTQSNGVAKSTFAYNTSNLQLDTETIECDLGTAGFEFSRVIDRSQDNLGRESGWTLGEPMSTSAFDNQVTYSYSATHGRLETVRRGDIPVPQEFDYTYTPNSNLIATITSPAHIVSNVYETHRNVLTSKFNNKLDTTTVSGYIYNVNNYGQRTNVETSGTAFAATQTSSWGYNNKGEVVKADHSANTAFNRAYQYDGIGNRLQGSAGVSPASVTTYTPNAVNQYTALNSLNPAFDADGNMTSGPLPANVNANSTLVWDGENRLIEAQVNGGGTVSYIYDAQSRRIAETVGSNIIITVYDGWNPIAEYNATYALTKTYTWGLDLSGSMQGAGGVGGLLMVSLITNNSITDNFFPTFDGNGNVSEYLDSNGNTVAHYEYDPFGKTVISNGSKAGDFSHRFSTKPLDSTTGLYYYGYRWYDSETGRWPSRDPIEEIGGENLYGFTVNDGVNWVDLLGLFVMEPKTNPFTPTLPKTVPTPSVAPSPKIWPSPMRKPAPGLLGVLTAAAMLGEMSWKLGLESVELERSLDKLEDIKRQSEELKRRLEDERRRQRKILVYRYARCSESVFPPGTWVTPSGGLSWDQAISISYMEDVRFSCNICEFRFLIAHTQVVWEASPVMGHRQGKLTAFSTPVSTRVIPNPN